MSTYSLEGRLGKVLARGAKLKGDVAEAVVSATLSLSSAEVTQLDLTLAEGPEFKLLRSKLFEPGSPTRAGSRLDYGNLHLEVRAVEVTPRGADHVLRVTARSVGVGKLKRARGDGPRKGISPTQFAKLEATRAGLKFVGQPSAKRHTIGRAKGETSWDTLQRLAIELGYVCFEVVGVLYFGKPTWLTQHTARLRVAWKGDDTGPALDQLPTCRQSGDDRKNVATLTDVLLRGDAGEEALPGMALILDGVPAFEGLYMIDAVTIPLAEEQPANITASTPVNPKPQPPPPPPRKGGAGGGVSTPPVGSLKVKRVTATAEQLGHAATIYRVGADMGIPRRGRVVAIATAIQESVLRNVSHGDRDSLGLFQQRPSQGWGTAAQVTTPTYAARKFYEALRKVAGWQTKSIAEAAQAVQRSAHPSAYAQWAGEAEAIVHAIEATRAPSAGAGGKGGATGAKSAAAFVAVALAQAGDHYIYGAEAAASNPNPNAFDCSELVQWAAARVGVGFVDGSSAQIAACKPISVATAIKTRGALLWHPGHIAISLGNGRTIEAANSRVGVVSYSAAGRFSRGGLIPGMRY